jgi:hypothetical protein
MRQLVLPTRFEALRQTADAENVDITRIVVPVKNSNQHIQELFLRIEQTRISRFEVIYGPSGSGKTTFLETLPLFFDGINVATVSNDIPLVNAVQTIRSSVEHSEHKRVIIYLSDRDNPIETDQEFFTFFEHLRSYFREGRKPTLVVWPVSRSEMAQKIFNLANNIGADSLIGNSREFYTFEGPPQEQFYKIADDTTRLMNNESSLEDFGIDEHLGKSPLLSLANVRTIASYFQRLIDHSNKLNSAVANLLEQKPRPHVWILLAGDEITEVMGTVSALTSGTQRKLDVAALTTDISDNQANTQYMKDWKPLQRYMSYLLRSLDVRIIELPPNLVLSVVRAFGDEELRSRLKQRSATHTSAIKFLHDSILGELILESAPRDRRGSRKTGVETRDEFIRVQSMARTNDVPLNTAFGTAIKMLLEENECHVDVGKKQTIYGTLRPDIHIKKNPAEPICLEFTWRTTGRKVADVDSSGNQNTLTPGHIRQYVLQKAYDYVKALGLNQISH